MTEKTIHLRIPITMAIGPVPANLTAPEQIFSFGIQNFGRVLTERGISHQLDGERAIATFAIGDENAKTQTARGLVLDDRAFRIQPAGDGHALEISTDLGATFKPAGVFTDFGFAQAVGTAWVDGRVEAAE